MTINREPTPEELALYYYAKGVIAQTGANLRELGEMIMEHHDEIFGDRQEDEGIRFLPATPIDPEKRMEDE